MSSWRLAFVLAGLSLAAHSLRASDADVATPSPALPPAPAAVQAELPPANVAPPPEAPLSGGAAEIAKLAQGGVGESVMLAFVGNVSSKFNLGSNQIIYLNDLGVSGEVVKAMIQRDASLDAASQAATASLTAPIYPNVPPPDDTASYPPAPPPPDNATAPDPPSDTADYATADDANYFYNSLAPYGSWINVNGCGLCWQPTVCLANRDWRPYGDRGRWLNSDCGWYWQSDYSWGWAPFHYGRWMNNPACGWVWSPDRVWGPAWVSWRQSADYCGWAPLPLSARFRAGTGFIHEHRAAGAEFEFGLRASHYTFIPLGCLSDYSPARYAVHSSQAEAMFHQTRELNHFAVENNRVVNHSINPREVSAVARTEIRRVEVREMSRDTRQPSQAEHLARSNNGLVIYHPPLPPPAVGRINVATATANTQRLYAPGRNFNAPRTSANAQPRPVAPPLPQMNFARTAPGISTAQPARSESYPAGSLVIIGRKTAAGLQSSPSAPNRSYSLYQTGPPQTTSPERPRHTFDHALPQTALVASGQSSFVVPARFTAAERMAGYSTPQNTAPEHAYAQREPAHSARETRYESHAETHAAPVEHASPVAAFHSSVSSLSPASVSGHR